jgi:MATE family, multidrug efflux pump
MSTLAARRDEMAALIRLALPLVAGFVGTQLMGFVDTAMVGRLGEAAIGGVGIGNGIFMAFGMIGLGCALGIDPLVAQAVGASERARARRIYWQGLRVAAAISVPLIAVILGAGLLVPLAGVEAETARNARQFLFGRAWNVVPLALFAAARSYLQAADVTRPIVVATVLGNVANFFGDAILIYGDRALAAVRLPAIGLPALGVFGAGLSSTLASVVQLLVLVAAVRELPSPADPERRRFDPAIVRRILAIGVPIALQLVVEISAFAGAGVLSGRIGRNAAAGNQIALSLASFTFMVPLGIASATAVRVGRAVGQRDRERARLSARCGFIASLSFMGCAAVAFFTVPAALARVLTNQAAAIASAVPLIKIAAVFQLSDGTQVTGAGALRGYGDTRSTLYANVVGYYALGLPLGAALAFGAGLGAPGLWWGLSAGLTAVALALVFRLRALFRREVARL